MAISGSDKTAGSPGTKIPTSQKRQKEGKPLEEMMKSFSELASWGEE